VDVKDILAPSRLRGLTLVELSATVSLSTMSDVLDLALSRSDGNVLRRKNRL
jgi:hypothetical protein